MSIFTLCLKYATARSARSPEFSWNPYGVSMTVALTGLPRRATSERCVLTMVGAVSPLPMIARMRGTVTGRILP